MVDLNQAAFRAGSFCKAPTHDTFTKEGEDGDGGREDAHVLCDSS